MNKQYRYYIKTDIQKKVTKRFWIWTNISYEFNHQVFKYEVGYPEIAELVFESPFSRFVSSYAKCHNDHEREKYLNGFKTKDN